MCKAFSKELIFASAPHLDDSEVSVTTEALGMAAHLFNVSSLGQLHDQKLHDLLDAPVHVVVNDPALAKIDPPNTPWYHEAVRYLVVITFSLLVALIVFLFLKYKRCCGGKGTTSGTNNFNIQVGDTRPRSPEEGDETELQNLNE